MEKPAYTIQELESYLLQKKAGHTDLLMEQKIREDDFLQTIVIGMEKTLVKNNNVATIAILEKKKERSWLALTPALAAYNNTIPNPGFVESIRQYFSLRNYDPQYLRIHLLLGFNCSCVIALVVVACWLNSAQDAGMLVSHLEGLAGYKP